MQGVGNEAQRVGAVYFCRGGVVRIDKNKLKGKGRFGIVAREGERIAFWSGKEALRVFRIPVFRLRVVGARQKDIPKLRGDAALHLNRFFPIVKTFFPDAHGIVSWTKSVDMVRVVKETHSLFRGSGLAVDID